MRAYKTATEITLCRHIKTCFNFELSASKLEIRDASRQFVPKLGGFNIPSQANEAAFNREVVAARAKARSAERFGSKP